MAPKHQAPRGTRDLLPDETARWRWAEERARGVLERYGYGEIRTPMFEDFELFARTSGESSDVVQKEMYRFQDLGERDLALRPEFTAGVLRAYLEHGLGGRTRVHRLWSAGPVFRYGRPQKGRWRQFSQINCELIGSPAPGADVEVITLFVDLYQAWGFQNLTVALNSLGTPSTRREYGQLIRDWLMPIRDKLSPESQRRLEINPLRVLDTKDEGDRERLGDLGLLYGVGPATWGSQVEKLNLPPPGRPRSLLDFLKEHDRASYEHFEEVKAGLEANGIRQATLENAGEPGIRYSIDHGLVRGLDYYTHTAFEVHDRSLGAQSALGGGGRYDGLVELLGGPPTPGVGFAIGLDRTVLTMNEPIHEDAPVVCIVSESLFSSRAAALARFFRQYFRVVFDVEARSLKSQLSEANKVGARFCVFFMEREFLSRKLTLKDLRSSEQRELELRSLLEFIEGSLNQDLRGRPRSHLGLSLEEVTDLVFAGFGESSSFPSRSPRREPEE
jgi:histidyl-tRNA synthetase